MDGSTVIIVATLQSFRIEEEAGRKVYESSGALQHHFNGLDRVTLDAIEKREDVSFPYSLANVLRIRRPIVIVDEAHNARTPLSFKTLAKFRPSAIIELTATPSLSSEGEDQHASNVLHQVSAKELEAEDMIKLPVRLETHPNWQVLLAHAIAQLDQLDAEARKEQRLAGEYLRPIMLIKAESRRGVSPVTHEVVRQHLIDQCNIPEEQIAVETGTTREATSQDLLSPDCKVRFVITVDALKEGWDCSFAYILCSVAKLRAQTAVEQLLGRVLRMPYARRKSRPALNRAYSFASSDSFMDAARALESCLIESGFNRIEASELMKKPSERGLNFSVPALAVQSDGQLELFEETLLLDRGWRLAHYMDLAVVKSWQADEDKSRYGEVKIDSEGKLRIDFLKDLEQELRLIHAVENWTEAEPVSWVDRSIPHPDIAPDDSLIFIGKVVESLQRIEGVALASLVRDRHRLCKRVDALFQECRELAKSQAFQDVLFDEAEGQILVYGDKVFRFDPDRYPCNWICGRSHYFEKHFYPTVGELKDEGEEFRCAEFLDRLPEVEFWVRNLERKQTSFWLPTSTDRFYPDFVAKLTDGRFLVVEYKGEDRWSNDDSGEKRRIGALWEEKSHGTCLFVMPKGPDLEAIRAKLR